MPDRIRLALLVAAVFVLSVSDGLIGQEPASRPASQPAPVLRLGQTEADVRAYLLARTPRFVTPSDPAGWEAQAASLRQRVLSEVVLRGVPESWLAGGPNVVWGDKVPGKGYVIRKLRFEAVPGLWVGGLLYEPDKLAGKVPAVLNVNGHVGEPGMTINYKQARCINLAKRGMIALNLEWIGMGQLRGPGYGHDELSYLDLCGRAGVSVFYLELKRGLDVLCAHPAADPDRVAVTGLSGGGWQTIFISSLDTRVKLAAPNAGYIGLEQRIWHEGDIGDGEQNPTDLVSVADYVHLTAMLYPRPALLIYNANDECCFRAERAELSVYEPVAGLYQLMGLPEHFQIHVNRDPGTHNYLQDNREAFYRFLNRHFLPAEQRNDKEIPVDDEIRDAASLAIDYPAGNANFFSLGAEAMKPLPRKPAPQGSLAGIDAWRRETREVLRAVVRPDPLPAKPLAVSPLCAVIHDVPDALGYATCLRTAGQWTAPMVVWDGGDTRGQGTTLIVADGGRADAQGLVAEILQRQERAITTDILFTGECRPSGDGTWKYAQMISTVGRRCLGVQVSQLDAVIAHIRAQGPDAPLRIVTKGRVAGLAALVSEALNPGRVNRIELREMDASLKDLVVKEVPYAQAPSVFCFGLLEVADVAELVALAHPTEVGLTSGR